MKVILVRHAQTAGNLRSNYVGRTDEPLAPEGTALARRIGADETVETVYTSALLRSRQTAAILFPKAEQRPRADLNEMDFGVFEGQNWKDLENDTRYAAWLDSQCEAPCPDGESKEDFTKRCRAAFRTILDEAPAPDATIHVVAHGGVIMSIMSGFVFPERGYFSWKTGYCQGYVIESDSDGRFRLLENFNGGTP